MSTIRVAVGEMDAALLPGTESWAGLIADLDRAKPDIFRTIHGGDQPDGSTGVTGRRGSPAFW